MRLFLIAHTILAVTFVDAAPKLRFTTHNYCQNRGEACTKLRFTTHNYCQNRGEACTKLKRAADVAAEALSSPESQISDINYCQLQGEACYQAKRNTLALAEATANVLSAVKPDANSCYATGGECNLATQQAIEQAASPYTGRVDSHDNELEKRSDDEDMDAYCNRPDGECTKLKRAAEAVAEALAEPKLRYTTQNYCQRRGEACTKLKRSFEEADKIIEKAKRTAEAFAEPKLRYTTHNYCQHRGEACT